MKFCLVQFLQRTLKLEIKIWTLEIKTTIEIKMKLNKKVTISLFGHLLGRVFNLVRLRFIRLILSGFYFYRHCRRRTFMSNSGDLNFKIVNHFNSMSYSKKKRYKLFDLDLCFGSMISSGTHICSFDGVKAAISILLVLSGLASVSSWLNGDAWDEMNLSVRIALVDSVFSSSQSLVSSRNDPLDPWSWLHCPIPFSIDIESFIF